MAHVVVEWTDNLEGILDIHGLLTMLAHDMRIRAGGAFPIGGIRARAIRLTDYVIADGKGPDDAFINIDIKIGSGRSDEFSQKYFGELFENICDHLSEIFRTRPFALSLYVAQVSGWKKNTIHERIGI